MTASKLTVLIHRGPPYLRPNDELLCLPVFRSSKRWESSLHFSPVPIRSQIEDNGLRLLPKRRKGTDCNRAYAILEKCGPPIAPICLQIAPRLGKTADTHSRPRKIGAICQKIGAYCRARVRTHSYSSMHHCTSPSQLETVGRLDGENEEWNERPRKGAGWKCQR